MSNTDEILPHKTDDFLSSVNNEKLERALKELKLDPYGPTSDRLARLRRRLQGEYHLKDFQVLLGKEEEAKAIRDKALENFIDKIRDQNPNDAEAAWNFNEQNVTKRATQNLLNQDDSLLIVNTKTGTISKRGMSKFIRVTLDTGEQIKIPSEVAKFWKASNPEEQENPLIQELTQNQTTRIPIGNSTPHKQRLVEPGQAYETGKRVNEKSANATSPKSNVDKTCHNGITANTQKKPETNINTVEVPTMDEVTKFLSRELTKFRESIKATVTNHINPKSSQNSNGHNNNPNQQGGSQDNNPNNKRYNNRYRGQNNNKRGYYNNNNNNGDRNNPENDSNWRDHQTDNNSQNNRGGPNNHGGYQNVGNRGGFNNN
ncbi:GATA zinc finger domain-containing protein 16-like [Nasonia vitripennis]|uniref:Uncharacterized protein n=1 Tax=Nasonia vitripennis TaxID=7425 RepID=A0A7M7R5Q6_NASVI|nr:GATA zinc finger domain-containing protein 16-like [Nasonia vitripennis]